EASKAKTIRVAPCVGTRGPLALGRMTRARGPDDYARFTRLRGDRRRRRHSRRADQLPGPEELAATLGLEDDELVVLYRHRPLTDRRRRLAVALGADVEGLAVEASRVD